MDKLGVELDEAAVKTAHDQALSTCPTCGRELFSKETVNVLVCPVCGTEPWEKKKKVSK